MEEIRKEQIEALETLKDYNVKIVKALENVSDELANDKKEDTDEYLDEILRGINWELQVINRTMDVLNEAGEQISKENVNRIIQNVNDAYLKKADMEMASVIKGELLPFFGDLNNKIEKVL